MVVVDVLEWSRFVDDFVDDDFVDGDFAGGRPGDDVLGGSDATTAFWASLPFLLGRLGRARFREAMAKASYTFPP